MPRPVVWQLCCHQELAPAPAHGLDATGAQDLTWAAWGHGNWGNRTAAGQERGPRAGDVLGVGTMPIALPLWLC